jgi:RimJ/RimL family protein N-acetyltransferase
MEIRPWRTGDDLLAAEAQPYLSEASLTSRFLAGTGGRLPTPYRRHIALGPRVTWDAQAAATTTHLVGWAEFGRRPDELAVADLAVLVADPWQRQGIATALVRALLPRLLAAGVRELEADVLPGNRAAHGLLRSLFDGRLRASYVDGLVHYRMPLDAPLDVPVATAVAAAAATG